MLYKFFICFLAGVGAGLGTGFAGMSAAAVISPMLITFLGVPAYEAVGIALASDVLASAVSAYTYGKNKNLDVKNGFVMMAAVLCFTLVGSWVSSLVPSSTMGGFSVFMTLLLGVKFIVRPVMTTKENMAAVSARKRFFQSVACGVLVGFICGFIGAGGGMMMLLVLTSVLGFELKTAVGTSVFIMTFTAFTGAVSHFAIGGAPAGFAYKAINTLDSMVGYKNNKYLYFGRVSAITDDIANFVPARIAGLLMIAAAFLTGYDAKGAAKVFFRDRKKHLSPNSAQTESACAGALGLMLGGTHNYFGKAVVKPTIGDNRHKPVPEHILNTHVLMYMTASLCLFILNILCFVINGILY